MPELPDIVIYIESIEKRILGQRLKTVRITSPFLLRTADPPLSALDNRLVVSVVRIGKRIVLGFEDEIFLVLHLMIAGRLHWREPGAKLGGKNNLAALDFPTGSLVLTEAGTKRRASIHIVQGRQALQQMDPGGIDVLSCNLLTFAQALQAENHTLKRSMTDPRVFSGIGNSYSDEILFEAQLSPLQLTQKLDSDQIGRLYNAARSVLNQWTVRLRQIAGENFPENVTAFRPEMAVHGRYGLPCPRCDSPVQRIRYADNETNYCAHCQTGGKLLSDRALSRLLGSDWPKTLDGLEMLTSRHREASE
jgi:formamidopyrimidine-DNA glycosylase